MATGALPQPVWGQQRTLDPSLFRTDLPRVSLGARPDDPKFDNGPIIQSLIDSGQRIPPGCYYHSTTIEIRGIVEGSGEVTYCHKPRSPAMRDAVETGRATVLIYNGPADRPAMLYRRFGARVDGLTLMRLNGDWVNKEGRPGGGIYRPKRDGSTAIKVLGTHWHPITGKLSAGKLSIVGFDTAVHISREPKELHACQNSFDWLWSQHNRVIFKTENKQSVNNHVRYLAVNGLCETVLDVRAGGFWKFDMLGLNNRALLLRLRAGSPNSNHFVFEDVRADNNSAGWRLVEADPKARGRMIARGTIGLQAEPARDWIVGNVAVEYDFWRAHRPWKPVGAE
jgi:hypothetical protein